MTPESLSRLPSVLSYQSSRQCWSGKWSWSHFKERPAALLLATLLGRRRGRAAVVHPRRGAPARSSRSALAACCDPEGINCSHGTGPKAAPVLSHTRKPPNASGPMHRFGTRASRHGGSFGLNSPKFALHARKGRRRGFANTHPLLPRLCHAEPVRALQSIRSTNPMTPPNSSSSGTLIPCCRSISLRSGNSEVLEPACIRSGPR